MGHVMLRCYMGHFGLHVYIGEVILNKTCTYYIYHDPPQTMKNKGFGHLETRLFTIKTSKSVGLGGI